MRIEETMSLHTNTSTVCDVFHIPSMYWIYVSTQLSENTETHTHISQIRSGLGPR